MASVINEAREASLRDYAAGRAAWRDLQLQGFKDIIEVLAGLADLGLRPFIAPMEGATVESRQRARARVAALLNAAKR